MSDVSEKVVFSKLFASILTHRYKRIIAWGSGDYFFRCMHLGTFQPDYVIDNDSSKWGTRVCGLRVCGPEILKNESSPDVLVVICSQYYNEIAHALDDFGRFDYVPGFEYKPREYFEQRTAPNVPDRHTVVTVSQGNYTLMTNGTAKCIDRQTKWLNEHAVNCLHVYWHPVRYRQEVDLLYFILQNGIAWRCVAADQLSEVLARMDHLVIHSLIRLVPSGLRRLLALYRKRIFYYLHDYNPICGQYQLLKNRAHFCNVFANGKGVCGDCRYRESQLQTQTFHEELLQQEQITWIAPARTIAKHMAAFYQQADPVDVTVIPHLTYSSHQIAGSRNISRIAFLGVPASHKGWSMFAQLVARLNGQYVFFHFGRLDMQLEYVCHIPVDYNVHGHHAMRDALIEHEIDAAFLWSTWPETYCFTLYEALEARCFVLTHKDSGNIADEVIRMQAGCVFDSLDACISFLQQPKSHLIEATSCRVELSDVALRTDFPEKLLSLV